MLCQLSWNVLIASSAVVMVAVGFTLIYRTARFLHFAQGAVFTLGAYSLFVSASRLRLPLLPAALLTVLVVSTIGILVDTYVYRPLRRRHASDLTLLLASLGLYVVLQNVISLAFGDSTRSIRIGQVIEGISVLEARITPLQLTSVCVSTVLIAALSLFLRYSRLGRAMRAVASDPDLAACSGVDSNRAILWAFAIGSALAGVAGMLYALDLDMNPTMGMSVLMMGVVAAVIGGMNSIPGVVLGALLLGSAQQFGVWYVSSQWQDAIAFIVLLVFLLFRPQGFMGRKVKKASV